MSIIQSTKKDSKKKYVEDIKIYLKKKKTYHQYYQYYQERKQKLPKYRRNYYLTQKSIY